MLITAEFTPGASVGKSKLLFWFGVAVVLLIKLVVVPMVTTPTMAIADVFTRHIPLWLAPLNWALFLFLVAVCGGPLLMPKYLSISLNVLWAASFLFFLGSWRFHPVFSPIISVLGYVGLYWLIPLWEAQLNQ
jgi:hypothetical protein